MRTKDWYLEQAANAERIGCFQVAVFFREMAADLYPSKRSWRVRMLRWFKSLFAWQNDHSTGVWLYQENRITGKRRAIQLYHGYQPLDREWLGLEKHRPF